MATTCEEVFSLLQSLADEKLQTIASVADDEKAWLEKRLNEFAASLQDEERPANPNEEPEKREEEAAGRAAEAHGVNAGERAQGHDNYCSGIERSANGLQAGVPEPPQRNQAQEVEDGQNGQEFAEDARAHGKGSQRKGREGSQKQNTSAKKQQEHANGKQGGAIQTRRSRRQRGEEPDALAVSPPDVKKRRKRGKRTGGQDPNDHQTQPANDRRADGGTANEEASHLQLVEEQEGVDLGAAERKEGDGHDPHDEQANAARQQELPEPACEPTLEPEGHVQGECAAVEQEDVRLPCAEEELADAEPHDRDLDIGKAPDEEERAPDGPIEKCEMSAGQESKAQESRALVSQVDEAVVAVQEEPQEAGENEAADEHSRLEMKGQGDALSFEGIAQMAPNDEGGNVNNNDQSAQGVPCEEAPAITIGDVPAAGDNGREDTAVESPYVPCGAVGDGGNNNTSQADEVGEKSEDKGVAEQAPLPADQACQQEESQVESGVIEGVQGHGEAQRCAPESDVIRLDHEADSHEEHPVSSQVACTTGVVQHDQSGGQAVDGTPGGGGYQGTPAPASGQNWVGAKEEQAEEASKGDNACSVEADGSHQHERSEQPISEQARPAEAKANNIVAGGTSFVSLVKQKEKGAEASNDGKPNGAKRGVQVKSLERAKDARREAELKEEERRKRREQLQSKKREGDHAAASNLAPSPALGMNRPRVDDRLAGKARPEESRGESKERMKQRLLGSHHERKRKEAETSNGHAQNSNSTNHEADAKRPRLLAQTAVESRKPRLNGPSGQVQKENQPPPSAAQNQIRNVMGGMPSHKDRPASPTGDGPRTIVISPVKRRDSDSDEKRSSKQPTPQWARNPYLRRQLERQREQDPDAIFRGCMSSACNLEDMFGTRCNRKREFARRTDSGNWSQDELTHEEEATYKRSIGLL